MKVFADYYAAENIPEDVINALYDISPTLRPMTGGIAHIGADSAVKEFVDHRLSDPNADNAAIDGADLLDDSTSEATRYKQQMQLTERGISLGDQAQNSDSFGNISKFETQLEKRVKETYRDQEAAALSRNASVIGGAPPGGPAAKQAGFFAQITLADDAWLGDSGVVGGWNAGTGVFDAPTQSTSTRALAETNILNVMTKINDKGGYPDKMSMRPELKVKFSNFMMTSSSRVGVLVTQAPGGQGGATAVQTVQVYETDHGTLLVLNNQIQRHHVVGAAGTGRSDVAIFQTDMAEVSDQWSPRAKRLATAGHGENWMVSSSFGLLLLNNEAHGGVMDNDYNVDMVA